jgi:nicotinamide mononucleotide transporter
MDKILSNIAATFINQSGLEIIAVAAAIVYLVLVVRENIWCWFFAFISTALFTYLFYHVSLLSESILNVYYLLMAIYGWLQWSKKSTDNALKIKRLPLKKHLIIIAVGLLLTPLMGYGMLKLGASFPYLDAFVAIFSVFATLMVAYKIFENWYYWLIIDGLSIYLFWQKQMYYTTLLYLIYIVLIFVGIASWKKIMDREKQQ